MPAPATAAAMIIITCPVPKQMGSSHPAETNLQ